MADLTGMLQAASGAGGEAPLGVPWNLEYAQFNGVLPVLWVNAEENSPRGVTLSPDGLRLYVIGSTGDEVNQYTLSTAWQPGTGSFVQNFSVAAQNTGPLKVRFKTDGTKMYVLGNNNTLYEYNLSIAWDISTASYSQFKALTPGTNAAGLCFRPTGTIMYITDDTSNAIYQYALSTAWNISTISLTRTVTIAGITGQNDIFMRDDGLKMYLQAQTTTESNALREYTLSSAFNPATASFVRYSRALYGQGISEFKSDGTRMVVNNFDIDTEEGYQMTTAWNISTAAYPVTTDIGRLPLNQDEEQFYVIGLAFKTDGTKIYVVNLNDNAISEFNLSSAWDITTMSYVQEFVVASPFSYAVYNIYFKPDGLKLYAITSQSTASVQEYTLSSAWNVTTASLTNTLSISAQEGSSPRGIFFKDDGTKMYTTGQSSDGVNQYDLSTPWDTSTASFQFKFSVSGQETNPVAVFFKPEGDVMYVMGISGDDINQYRLSTPWNVSTASYSINFNTRPQSPYNAYGLAFKSDGTKFYIGYPFGSYIVAYDIQE